MDTSKASPRPWDSEHAVIYSKNDEHIAQALPIRNGRNYYREQQKANAQLIVTAVNQHQEFIDLIRDIPGVMDAILSLEAQKPSTSQLVGIHSLARHMKERAHRALEGDDDDKN